MCHPQQIEGRRPWAMFPGVSVIRLSTEAAISSFAGSELRHRSTETGPQTVGGGPQVYERGTSLTVQNGVPLVAPRTR